MEPSQKRAKLENGGTDDEASPNIFDNGDGTEDDNKLATYGILGDKFESQRSEIQKTYATAKPYPHAQIFDLFQPDFLNTIKEEIKSQTTVNFKESDLFRVYQSIDMANLEPGTPLAKKLIHVMKLRELLYSQEWRSTMEEMTDLPAGTLTEQIDCACNCHAPGCHLLCHDDVIGTRKISYIIYLTESDWKPEEGGSLELYEPQLDEDSQSDDGKSTTQAHALPLPVSRAWPIFNSMAFFVVTPGSSFHAVQEVVGDRPRLSLQGWYHAKDPPENIELATLQQLKLKKNVVKNDGNKGAKPESDASSKVIADFTEEDREYLKKYIQSEFLAEESMQEIQERFEKDSSAQLQNFLKPTWVPTMQPQKPIVYDEAYYSSNVSPEWKLQGPAHKQRYLKYIQDAETTDDALVVGSLLQHIKTNVFESDPMRRYLAFVTGLGQPGVKESQIRQFRPGLDYTVAHYGLLVDQSVLDATMCFVYDENDDKDAWESGDVGGFECYIEADDIDHDHNDAEGNRVASSDQGPADEYNEDDDTELLSVSASNNTLSLVFRDPGTMRFVKYVGSSAPSSRFDICMEYDVPPDDEDEAGKSL
ncbi:MAG: hypothetical protein SGILL_002199 [Bacillariaceae sp.]